jgi:hypothetical protein
MNGTTWARWAPASALVYGVLYVVGMILIVVVGEEVDEKADADMLAYYADSGNRTNDIIGLVLVAVSLIFFLFFVSALRERLREADAEGSVLSGVAAAAGAGAAVLFLAGAAAFTATALGRDFIDEFEVDPNAARLQFALGYGLLLGAVILSCGMVLATCAVAFRTSVLPTWVTWVGLVAVVLAIAEAFLLPLFVIPVWSLIVGAVLATRAPSSQPGTALGSGTA